ncbi:unnamed protein product, partial [Urochloa humidicola]
FVSDRGSHDAAITFPVTVPLSSPCTTISSILDPESSPWCGGGLLPSRGRNPRRGRGDEEAPRMERHGPKDSTLHFPLLSPPPRQRCSNVGYQQLGRHPRVAFPDGADEGGADGAGGKRHPWPRTMLKPHAWIP